MSPTPRSLELVVESPLVRGSGNIPVGDIDVDVASDRDGVPFLPRQTLSARLRDSCLETVLVWPHLAPAAIDLLGEPGLTTTTPRLQVGTARPVLAEIVRTENESRTRNCQPLLDEMEVRGAFTLVLVSTAITPSGAPAAHTRRAVRAVRPGVRFVAPLTWSSPQTTDDANAVVLLARAVLGLRQIGQGGTRGQGAVRCSLDGDRAATTRLAFAEEKP